MSEQPLPDAALRAAALAAVGRLDALGLNRGSTGNLSVRSIEGQVGSFWITPTGMAPDDLGADDFVHLGADGAVQIGRASCRERV